MKAGRGLQHSFIFASFLAWLFLLDSVHAEPPTISQYRNQVLAQDLSTRITPRLEGYFECVARSELSHSPKLRQTMQMESKFLNAQKSSHPAFERTLLLLELERDLLLEEKSPGPCQFILKNIRSKYADQERRKYKAAFALSSLIQPSIGVSPAHLMLMELDPHCALVVTTDFAGNLDTHPCFAGASIILNRSFPAWGDPFDERLAHFEKQMALLKKSIHEAPENTSLDLELAIRASAIEVIRLLTLSLTSATSANGYVDAYGIQMIRRTFTSGGNALTAYKRYMRIKNLADEGRHFLRALSKRKLEARLLGFEVSEWNRHNWMATSLCLEYQDHGRVALAKQLPIVLGTIYEAQDAVSHLKAGQSLTQSWAGFRQDRSRYVSGVKLARKLK